MHELKGGGEVRGPGWRSLITLLLLFAPRREVLGLAEPQRVRHTVPECELHRGLHATVPDV